LIQSIKHIGILNIPTLLEREDSHSIICGFRRIEVCRRLGWSKLEAKVFDPDTMRLNCIKYAVADNAFQRPLNLIEKSRSIKMFSEFIKDPNKISEELSVLGLYIHPKMIKKLKDFCHLPLPLQDSILTNTISLSMVLELARMSWDDAKGFVELFDMLKPSLNKQREIVTLVKEIAMREGASIQQIIEELHLKNIMMSDDLDKNQKAYHIRMYLKQRRFPNIADVEKTYDKYCKKLDLKKGLKLIPPTNFESQTFTLQLSFNNMNQLKDLNKALDSLLENPNFDKIVN